MSNQNTLMDKFTDNIVGKLLLKLQEWILLITSLLTVFTIVLSVVMRYIFKSNLYGIEEIIVIIAFWLYFIGGAHGSYERSHIQADLVSIYITNEKLKVILNWISSLITTVVTLILTKWGYGYFIWGIERGATSTSLRIPLVVSQSAIFVGLILMSFYFIIHLITDTSRMLKVNKS